MELGEKAKGQKRRAKWDKQQKKDQRKNNAAKEDEEEERTKEKRTQLDQLTAPIRPLRHSSLDSVVSNRVLRCVRSCE
jgi:hypothetical protein